MTAWISNNPKASALLIAADAAYDRAIKKSDTLPLAQKIIAVSAARQIRDAAYNVAKTADIGE